MADAAVEFLLENLKQALLFYTHLISGTENEFEQLKDDFSFFEGFLQNAAKLPVLDARFREIERRIRDVVYVAEDTIDSWVIDTSAPKGAKRFFLPRRSNLNRISLAREVHDLRYYKMRYLLDYVFDEIEEGYVFRARANFAEIVAKIEEGYVFRVNFAEIEEGSNTRMVVPDRRHEANAVGFEDDEKIIIGYLLEEREQLDVISITGMPGLGKTTLAGKVFHHPEIQYKFYTRIWIDVSQNFDIRDILLRILKQITRPAECMFHSMNEADLVLTVRARLEKEVFLLMMDDIWTTEAWDVFKHVLPKSNRMSKVLITSRQKRVCRYANFAREPHMLRFLNKEESCQLLLSEVFGELSCPPELEGPVKCIVDQCGGLPLAILVIGGILALHENIWSRVSKDLWSYVMEEDPQKRVLNVVGSSYNNMSYSLKHCFLYLGVFPKDYEIPVSTLTRLWIAEGFIKHKEGKSLEQTAEDNLKELITMNLVMVGITTPYGKLRTCRVHEVVREFCISRAAPSDQNFFQEIKMSQESGDSYLSPYSYEMCWRICIHSHILKFLVKRPMARHVRSFLSFCEEPLPLDPKHESTFPDAFRSLRVLDSKSFKVRRFPMKLTKLLHLRYITLSCDNLISLPETLSNLWNLQTLLVYTNSPTLEIKANVWKMIQLRHLKSKAEIILSVKGEGEGGGNLQTLSRLSAKCCNEEVLKRTPNLRTLRIHGSLATGPLFGLPPVNSFPRNIKRLTLSATYLEWTHMSTLGMFASLEVLKLKDHAFVGDAWRVEGGFPSLQFLLIDGTDLVLWMASDDQFPKLTCLVLKNCVKLLEIPLTLAKSLRVLNIERVIPISAICSARKIEEKKKEMLALQESSTETRDQFKLSLGPGCGDISSSSRGYPNM